MKATGSKLLLEKFGYTFTDSVSWRGNNNYHKSVNFSRALRKSLKSKARKEIEREICEA